MDRLSETDVEKLNYKLDDLKIMDTFRFSLPELLENIMTESIAITCRVLIQKLRFYDESILPVPINPEFSQIWWAIRSRGPPFVFDESYTLYQTLDFLCTQLQGERMLRYSQGIQQRNIAPNKGKVAFRLDKITRELRVNSEASDEITVISDIINYLTDLFSKAPREEILNPPTILGKYIRDINGLTPTQVDILNRVNTALIQDFNLRRRMLIKRLDVTIRSFLWGERASGKEDEIVNVINEQRRFLSEQPTFYQIPDALSAPITLLHEHSKKITGGAGTAGSIVKKVLIGKVPDRGGRPMAEHRAKAIIAKEGRGGGGRGGGFDHRSQGGRGRGDKSGRGGGGGGGGSGKNDQERKRKEEESGTKEVGSKKKGRVVTIG